MPRLRPDAPLPPCATASPALSPLRPSPKRCRTVSDRRGPPPRWTAKEPRADEARKLLAFHFVPPDVYARRHMDRAPLRPADVCRLRACHLWVPARITAAYDRRCGAEPARHLSRPPGVCASVTWLAWGAARASTDSNAGASEKLDRSLFCDPISIRLLLHYCCSVRTKRSRTITNTSCSFVDCTPPD